MKRAMILFVLVLLITSASAIRINEVEMNPVNGGAGTEWIELYNDGGEVDISLWELYDGLIGPKNIFTIPSGIILAEGDYYVAELSKTVLNNGGDFASLYNLDGEEIDKTQMIKETKWGVETWQWCDDWKFTESTKGLENDCASNDEEVVDEPEPEIEKDIIENKERIIENVNKSNEIITGNNVISLTPKDIKSSNGEESLSKTKYVAYGFVLFCVLLIVLYGLKYFKKNGKSEFDG